MQVLIWKPRVEARNMPHRLARFSRPVFAIAALAVIAIAAIAVVSAYAVSGQSFTSQLATHGMTVVQRGPSSVSNYPLTVASEFTGHVIPSSVVQVDCIAATDQGVALCSQMPNLELASLTGPGLTDAGLAYLAFCPRLKELCLANTSIDGTGLGYLRQNAALERLDLSGIQIDDETVDNILHLQSVQKLVLSGSLVSDKSLPRLFMMPNLSLLYLKNTSVSETMCQSLVDTYPNVRCTLVTEGHIIQLSPNNNPVRVAIVTNSK